MFGSIFLNLLQNIVGIGNGINIVGNKVVGIRLAEFSEFLWIAVNEIKVTAFEVKNNKVIFISVNLL